MIKLHVSDLSEKLLYKMPRLWAWTTSRIFEQPGRMPVLDFIFAKQLKKAQRWVFIDRMRPRDVAMASGYDRVAGLYAIALAFDHNVNLLADQPRGAQYNPVKIASKVTLGGRGLLQKFFSRKRNVDQLNKVQVEHIIFQQRDYMMMAFPYLAEEACEQMAVRHERSIHNLLPKPARATRTESAPVAQLAMA